MRSGWRSIVAVTRKTVHPSATRSFWRARSSSNTRRVEWGTNPSNSTATFASGHARSRYRTLPPTRTRWLTSGCGKSDPLDDAQHLGFPHVACVAEARVPLIEQLENDGAAVPTWRPEFLRPHPKPADGGLSLHDRGVEHVLEEGSRKLARHVDQCSGHGGCRNPVDDVEVEFFETVGRGRWSPCRRPPPPHHHDLRTRRWCEKPGESENTASAGSAIDRQHARHGQGPPVGWRAVGHSVDTRRELIPGSGLDSASYRRARERRRKSLGEGEHASLQLRVAPKTGIAIVEGHAPIHDANSFASRRRPKGSDVFHI